jgi:hypothetical protein
MPDGSSATLSPWDFEFDVDALRAKYREERERRVRNDADTQYLTIGRGLDGDKFKTWLTDP